MFRTPRTASVLQGMAAVLAQPALEVEVVVLLAPQHAGQRLAVDATLILGERPRRDPLVELVGVGDAAREDLLEIAEGIRGPVGRQAQADRRAAARRHVEGIVGGRLGPGPGGIHRLGLLRDHPGVEGVLDVRRRVRLAPQALRIALVLGEEQLRGAVAVQPVFAEVGMRRLNDTRRRLPQRRLARVLAPRPGVAEPQRRQDAQPGRLRPAIVDGDADQHVLRTRLGVLDEHVEVAVAVEDAGIEQLVLELLARPAPVGLDQVPVGKLALRVLVQVLHVRVRGRAIEVEVVLLHILAVVALAVGEPEQALLEDRVALVPQRQREAQQLLVVAQSAEPVLAPPVGARTCLVVGEVVPGVAVLAVVLADRAPLPLAEIRSPFLPRDLRLARLVQTRLFRHIHDRRVHACLRCQWVDPSSTQRANPRTAA